MPNPHLALAPPTIYWDSQSRASGGNAKVRAREYLTDAKIARLLHQAGAAPLRTSGTIDLPRQTYARNEYKSLECPEIVMLSRPCHRPRVPRVSSLRGLVPRRRTMIFGGNSSLPPV
jgi:hypothetical protein